MNGLREFNIAPDCKINFYNLKVSDTCYTKRELIENLPAFNKFREDFKCTTDEMLELITELCITDKDLFDYSVCGSDFKVGEKLVYTTKKVRSGYNWTYQDVFYDVFITSTQFANLALNKIAKEIMLRRFPFFLQPPFAEKVKRFKDSIKSFPFNELAQVDDLDAIMLHENKLTLGDIIKLFKDKNYINSSVIKSRLSVYAESPGSLYLSIDKEKGYSLYLTVDSLIKKDWGAIENIMIHSICLYDKNGNIIKNKWYDGKQKNAPYFNNIIVKELKRILLST